MNDIQISLKAKEEDGVLSIQGIDMFRLIDTDWNWDNISSIKNPHIKAFFIQAEELFRIDDTEESEDEFEVYDDSVEWSSPDVANEYWLKTLGDTEFEFPEEMEDLSENIDIHYDIEDDFYRTEIRLLTPYNKILWDESVYHYIYENINLWIRRIEEDINIYKELSSIINDFDRITSAIRKANGPSKAIQNLIQEFGISKLTAISICDMRTSTLAQLTAEDYTTAIQNREKQRVIFNKLIGIKKKIEKI